MRVSSFSLFKAFTQLTKIHIHTYIHTHTHYKSFLRLPNELQTPTFEDAPPNPNAEVITENQVNTLIIDNAGAIQSNVTFLSRLRNVYIKSELVQQTVSTITGLGMGPDRTIAKVNFFGGIQYANITSVIVDLGNGRDYVYFNETEMRGRIQVETNGGADKVFVTSVSGHTVVRTGDESDEVVISNTVSSDLVLTSLFTLDGGSGLFDRLLFSNLNEGETSQSGYVAAHEFGGLGWQATSNFIQLLPVAQPGEQYTVTLTRDGRNYTFALDSSTTELDIQRAIQKQLYPKATCGIHGVSRCTTSTFVIRIGEVFVLEFEGELHGAFTPGVPVDLAKPFTTTLASRYDFRANVNQLLDPQNGTVAVTSLQEVVKNLPLPYLQWTVVGNDSFVIGDTDLGLSFAVSPNTSHRFVLDSAQFLQHFSQIRLLVSTVRSDSNSDNLCNFTLSVINAAHGDRNVFSQYGFALDRLEQLAFPVQDGDEAFMFTAPDSTCVLSLAAISFRHVTQDNPLPADLEVENITMPQSVSGSFSGVFALQQLDHLLPGSWSLPDEKNKVRDKDFGIAVIADANNITGKVAVTLHKSTKLQLSTKDIRGTELLIEYETDCFLEISRLDPFRELILTPTAGSTPSKRKLAIDHLAFDEAKLVFSINLPKGRSSCSIGFTTFNYTSNFPVLLPMETTSECPTSGYVVDSVASSVVSHFLPAGRWSLTSDGPLRPAVNFMCSNDLAFSFFGTKINSATVRLNVTNLHIGGYRPNIIRINYSNNQAKSGGNCLLSVRVTSNLATRAPLYRERAQTGLLNLTLDIPLSTDDMFVDLVEEKDCIFFVNRVEFDLVSASVQLSRDQNASANFTSTGLSIHSGFDANSFPTQYYSTINESGCAETHIPPSDFAFTIQNPSHNHVRLAYKIYTPGNSSCSFDVQVTGCQRHPVYNSTARSTVWHEDLNHTKSITGTIAFSVQAPSLVHLKGDNTLVFFQRFDQNLTDLLYNLPNLGVCAVVITSKVIEALPSEGEGLVSEALCLPRSLPLSELSLTDFAPGQWSWVGSQEDLDLSLKCPAADGSSVAISSTSVNQSSSSSFLSYAGDLQPKVYIHTSTTGSLYLEFNERAVIEGTKPEFVSVTITLEDRPDCLRIYGGSPRIVGGWDPQGHDHNLNTLLVQLEDHVTTVLFNMSGDCTLKLLSVRPNKPHAVGLAAISKDLVNVNQRIESGILYYNFEIFEAVMSNGGLSFNAHGTSAETKIRMTGSDNAVYVSSDRPFKPRAEPVVLPGHLRHVVKPLVLHFGAGDNRMYISDADAPKLALTSSGSNSSSPSNRQAVLMRRDALIGAAPANIFFDSAGTFGGGISVWLGSNNNDIRVLSTHSSINLRTTTMLHTGKGDDSVFVRLTGETDGFLVVSMQEGNDFGNFTEMNFSPIVFGGLGDDHIIGTARTSNIVFGDDGVVEFSNSKGDVLTTVRSAGVSNISSFDVNISRLITDDVKGGQDRIFVGPYADMVLGGLGDDFIDGNGYFFVCVCV